ncbi:MAG: sigma-54 dependent transcriptional regulator [Haliscomenobacter sp.]|uniref:sigma-54-dependent transcriptional regulator n=1 Tax=Haliscomenobacter sp. TaxID=2717303 RepID=UPI0029A05382|nr:sigma-54 dependent transcriptional regulator [Haliscomenobacter sp.]MDX2068132.1 sigma-54 dependent transcriptional regulator [Haliscomenobacter sp.]
MKTAVLIIDDEVKLRSLLARLLQLEDYEVSEAGDCQSGLKKLAQQDFPVVLCDVKLPDGNGVELTAEIKQKYPLTEVILLTAYGNIPDGVKAIKNGAFDYLVKGDDNNRIITLLAQATEKALRQRSGSRMSVQGKIPTDFQNIIGRSPAIQKAIELAEKVAPTNASILLTGETGTGKDVFAQAIHQASMRKDKAFVALNCAALSREIIESELFGHKAGAFTGAIKDKKGLLEEAHEGTLFLDEIGEMPLDLQTKLLRVLENGEFLKVGQTKTQKVDVRIIAATNRNMEQESNNGQFRMDLYYRLATFAIHLPSLNERLEDIPSLVQHFMEQFSQKLNKKISRAHPEFLKALHQHQWRGNIRELRNTIERACILSETSQLESDSLPWDFLQPSSNTTSGILSLREVEKRHISRMLEHTHGNKTQTAELLGIGLTTLYAKIKEYQL